MVVKAGDDPEIVPAHSHQWRAVEERESRVERESFSPGPRSRGSDAHGGGS